MNQVQTGFHYRMELVFDGPVQCHHYTIKCLPQNDLRQQILRADTNLFPAGHSWESRDAFGNRELLGLLKEPHRLFSVQVEGEALLTLREDGAVHSGNGIEEGGIVLYPEEGVREEKLGIYRYPTHLTRPGEKIRAYYEQVVQELLPEIFRDREKKETGKGADRVEQAMIAISLMHRLHKDFSYQKAATDVTTTAEQAFLRGAGVCQDYAHIFISLLRLAGIPARYVTGMLQGEGESHAWVEAALGKYWYGLDPTNDCTVAAAHIKIGAGRDFADCRISQGIFFGCGSISQQQIVRVSVEQQ